MKNSKLDVQQSSLNGIKLSSLLLSSSLLLLVTGWLFGFPETLFDAAQSEEHQELVMGQSEVFLVVNWPAFAQENTVRLRNSGGTVVATVTSPVNGGYSATVSMGCQDDGAGYTLRLLDSPNDGWDGAGSFVRVEDVNGNILLNNVDLTSGNSPQNTSSFSVSGGGAACATCSDGIQNGSETGVDCGGPDCAACVNVNEICVNVFNDYNSNGTQDGAGELGIDGITITAYDASNNASPFTYVSDGNYTFTPGNNDIYRVEVTGIPTELEPTVAGATTVFFINRGNKVEVGLHQPAEYFPDDDVFISVPCYVDGPSNGANSNQDVLIITSPDELSGGIGNINPTSYYVAAHNEIGATFGVAYSRAAETLFAAAFAKRHTAFGPSGTGAIYEIGLTSTVAPITASTPSLLLDLDTYFGANTAGANTHPDATADFNRDPDTYDAVGKIGLGGLAMSEDENVLWTINLADRRLYEIPLGGTRENPTAPAGAGSISRWPASGDLTDLPGLIGSAAERDQNIRPFAVTCHRGAIYIGLVATGESSVVANTVTGVITNTGDQTLMRGYIYKFDPATDVFTQILDFPLNYVRGQAIDFCTNNARGAFFPWAPIYDQATMEAAVIGTSGNTNGTDGIEGTPDDLSPERAYPQAWLTDIAFDEQGKIIIGIRDRFADQHGFKKLPPTNLGADPDLLWNADGAGDILVASPNTTDGGATYVLESNSGNGVNGEPFGPTTGMDIAEGPGNGEFFFDDRYRPANATADGGGQCPGMMPDVNDLDPILDPQFELGHDEISLGGLFVYNGTGNVIVSVYDPINDYDNFNQAGYLSLSTTDGSRQGAALVYASQDFEGGTVDNINTFGKGNGLGDIEGVAPPAPLQVGNRLWLDGNNNGRQDADEDGINGVLVELFKETAPGVFTKVAETTTAADALQGNGFFIFSDNSAGDQTWVNGFTEVQAEMDYEIRISLAAIQAVDGTVAAFTTANANGISTNNSKTDLNDSDASGTGVISFTTGIEGENNHTLDIGVTNMLMCSVTGSIVSETCDGMGTPNTADDTYAIVVTATVTNGSGNYDVLVGGVEVTANISSGTSTTITVPASGGTVDITFRDATDDTCISSAVTSGTLSTCSPLACSVTGSIVSETCDDMSTANPADDTYDIVVTATVTDGSGAYDVLVNGAEVTANITSGTSTTITLPAGGATVDITFRDATDDGCVSSAVTSSSLNPCSACGVTGSIVSETCDDKSSADPSDDTDIVVTATVLGDVLVDGVEATANVASGTSTTITSQQAAPRWILPSVTRPMMDVYPQR